MGWTSKRPYNAGSYPNRASNRGYQPEQLIEQMIVSIWCGAARFSHADITRLDATLVRLFDWGRAAGHKAIVRLFQRFDQPSATRVQSSSYRWLFDMLHLFPITLGDDAGLQPDECVSPYGDATKSSSHSVHAASQGAGCGGVLERPLRQWFQADVSTGCSA